MKEKILITSLVRTSETTPWRVGIYNNEQYTFFLAGNNGNVAMSPRFHSFIKKIEERTTRYPVDISFQQISTNREMEITKIRDQIVYIDCGVSSERLVPQARFRYSAEVAGSPLAIKDKKNSSLFSIMDISQNIASNALDYVAIVSITSKQKENGIAADIIDGDTIHVTVETSTDMLRSYDISEGDKIEVRYNGVYTPEKRQAGAEAYKDPKNTQFGKMYGVSMDDMYNIRHEAHVKNADLLGNGDFLIILNFDRESHGEQPQKDSGYDRYVCDVYATRDRNPAILMDKLKRGDSFVHVCKTLLTTKSKEFNQVPLGLYDFSYSYQGTTVLNTFSWAAELGLKIFDFGKGPNLGMINPDLMPDVAVAEDDVTIPDQNLDTDTVNFSYSTGPNSNNLDFFEAYDDRIDEFTKGITNVNNLHKHSKVRIGDVILTIPPLAIDVQKTSSISKVKTMRTKSSILVNKGQTLTTLTMDLYFHDLESINGKKYPWKKNYAKGEEAKYFFVDGLRPLLAQFSKVPFVPIDNYYINETLGVRDVALMDIEVTTVPNFPESISAKITLVEFNAEAYLMEEGSLAASVNYPMMRWYYNESMADRGSKHRFFKGLEGLLTNEIKFTLADETFLEKRKDAINFIKNADSPEKVRMDLKNKNVSYQTKTQDANTVKEILQQIESYEKETIKEYTVITDKPLKDSDDVVDVLRSKYDIKKETAENAVTAGNELFTSIYNSQVGEDAFYLKVVGGNLFIPYESNAYYKIRFGNSAPDSDSNIKNLVDYSDSLYEKTEKQGIVLFKDFKDVENQAAAEKAFKSYYVKYLRVFAVPYGDKVKQFLNSIKSKPGAMENEVDKYEKDFEKYVRVIETSEQGVPMKDFEMKGTCIPISINARYSNEYSMAHVQSGEAPTLQYMGGGDTYLDMVLEIDEEAAQRFATLLRKSDEYAKQYNQGITNGYIGIENQLAQLFSVRYIMFDSVRISTVSGFPGRFQINISAISFDKTQRQREELKALPGNSSEMTLDMLKNNKNAYANDRMIEDRLKYLEVYPDLELPTYDEINAVLKELDAGSCKEYLNPTKGTYLDPDFYFSTKITMRSMIEDGYQESHQLNMFDPTGVAAYSSSGENEKLFNTTDGDWAKLKELEKTEGVEPTNWVFQWNKDNNNNADNTSAGQTMSEKSGATSIANSDVKNFMQQKNDKGENAYAAFPSQEEWNRLFGSQYTYQLFANSPQPSEALIYKELNSLVDKYFSKFYSKSDFIKKFDTTKSSSTTESRVSYSDPNSYYAANFAKIKKEILGDYGTIYFDPLADAKSLEKPKKLTEILKKGAIKEPKVSDEISAKDITSCGGKPTKERFMTLMKAFLDKMSKWQHYNGKVPNVSKNLNKVGLCQMDITGKDMTVDEAKKLMYNWRYNLEKAVSMLSNYYDRSTMLNADLSNFEAYCRPADAMFVIYEGNGAKDPKTSADIENSDVASGTMNRFKSYALKPFNTFSGFNTDVYKGYASLSLDNHVSLGEGSADDYGSKLIDLEYYELSVLEDKGLTVESSTKRIKEAMKEYLKQFTKEQLFQLYQNHVKKLYQLNKVDKKWTWVKTIAGAIAPLREFVTIANAFSDISDKGEKDSNGYFYTDKIIEKGAKEYEVIRTMNKTAEKSVHSNNLVNEADPQTLYQEMFYDLRYHDQRGRMIRAFPGFQMFIIHEGDWFGNYKFWDNMYGFNAIESFDVYRSRKIAADTAVISMTNVYSNLTTRRTDVDFIDREFKWWDNYIWNKIPQDLIDKKEKQVYKNIALETGARVNLRMGYSSNAADLPIIFNGTITEMEVGDLIDIVAQGDGIELGNVVSGDPDDNNDGLFSVEEPRDLICSLMSSKGSWLKDFFNNVSEGLLSKNNPLGIMHFGQPFDTNDSTASAPLGNLIWSNDQYGEVAQNIYSSNGTPTYSQWMHPNGERNNILSGSTWKHFWDNKFKIFNPGDENNVVVKFYNNTVWDIIQTITYTSPDYIAAVHPFELRSTLFFGKPYWRCSFGYDSRYEFDAATKAWVRHLEKETRRPYMQHKFYTSGHDIIQNNIRASEDGVYTNVIVNYDGYQTPVLYADADIRYDKQKTRVIEADIVAKFPDFYTSEVMATYYGCSALRDNLKDMYKGNLLVMGDPTVKPHDMMYINDEINDMNGTCLVKAVTHHFSMDTGFVTSIEPDLLIVNDDQVILEMGKWYFSYASKLGASVLGRYMAKKVARNTVEWISKSKIIPEEVKNWSNTKTLRKTLEFMDDGSKEMKDVFNTLDDIIKGGDDIDKAALRSRLVTQLKTASAAIPEATGKVGAAKVLAKKVALQSARALVGLMSEGAQAAKITRGLLNLGRGILSLNPLGFVINVAVWIGSEMLFEHYRRFKENLQCVIAVPLTYRGKELTAGINNHAGMIYGEPPGKFDQLFDATFFSKDGKDVEGVPGLFIIKTLNLITGGGGQYADSEKTKALNELGGQ